MDYTDKVYFFIELILDVLFGIIIFPPLFVFGIRKLLLTNKISSGKIPFLQTVGGKTKSKVLLGKIRIAFFAILGIVLVPLSIYRMIPEFKDIPDFISGNYLYTEGIVKTIEIYKSYDVININGDRIYESTVFPTKLKTGRIYRIAYLKNSRYCVGYKEID